MSEWADLPADIRDATPEWFKANTPKDMQVMEPEELAAAYRRIGYFGVPSGGEDAAACDFCRELTNRDARANNWRSTALFMLEAAMMAFQRADEDEMLGNNLSNDFEVTGAGANRHDKAFQAAVGHLFYQDLARRRRVREAVAEALRLSGER